MAVTELDNISHRLLVSSAAQQGCGNESIEKPSITNEQLIEIFQQGELAGIELAKLQQPGCDSVGLQVKELEMQIECGRQALEDLMINIRPLVRDIAFHFNQKSNIPIDDLVQYGYVGAMQAVRKFHIESGATFVTFAFRRIKGCMIDAQRDGEDNPSVPVIPRVAQQNVYILNAAIESFNRENGSTPSPEELVKLTGFTFKEVKFLMKMKNRTSISLDSLFDTDGLPIVETLLTDNEPIENQDALILVKSVLESLNLEEQVSNRELSIFYIWLNGFTMKEIGVQYEIGESRVSQIIKTLIKKVQAEINITDK